MLVAFSSWSHARDVAEYGIGLSLVVAHLEQLEDRALLSVTIAPLSPPTATEGISTGTVVVAHFTDANPTPNITDFTATIHWGDGSTGTATSSNDGIVASGDGFDVQGSHTYSEEFTNHTFTVDVADLLGSVTQSNTNFNVADAELLGLATTSLSTLVNSYLAEGNTNDSADSNHGTAPNGVGYAPGISGQAFSFNGGNQFVSINRSVQDDFTLAGWIKTNANSLTGSQFFHGNGLIYADVPGEANDFGTAILNNKFAFGVGNPANTIQSTTSVTDGTWHFVTAVRNESAGSFQVYVNGALESMLSGLNTGPLDDPPDITLGGNTIDSRYYSGLLDNVQIYDQALSSAQVLALYTGSAPLLVDGTAGSYSINVVDDGGSSMTTLTGTAMVAFALSVPLSGSVYGNGNLVLTGNPGMNNSLTLTYDPDTSSVIVTSTSPITAGNGATQIDSTSISITQSLIIRHIQVDGTDAYDDTLVVDSSNGNPIPSGGLIFTGGTGGHDSLTVTGGSATTITHTFANANNGSVNIDGNVITYFDLEPINDNPSAMERIFTFTGGAETITVTDGTAMDGMTMIDSIMGESVYFINPTVSLTINAGGGDDTITVNVFDTSLLCALTINGNEGNDTVNLNGDITFASEKNLDLNLTNDASVGDVDVINVGSNANLILSGNGVAIISLTIIVNNKAPTVTLAVPSASITKGGPITYTVTDANFDAATLTTSDFVLNTSGTATGTLALSGSGNWRTLTISGITGDGALGTTLPAGLIADLVGNKNMSAAASSTFSVDNTPPTTAITASPSGTTTDLRPWKSGTGLPIQRRFKLCPTAGQSLSRSSLHRAAGEHSLRLFDLVQDEHGRGHPWSVCGFWPTCARDLRR